MSYSLNEIEALCRKATRGAGFDWGHAEDAGKAVRWLEGFGQPGAESLLYRLEENAPLSAPTIERANWHGDGALCPIITGASLSDHAATLGDDTFTLKNVSHPILLAAFAASVAALTQRATRLEWAGASVTLHGTGARFDGKPKALLAVNAPSVTCRHVATPPSADAQSRHRATLPADIYGRLNTFAQRTYAPATEASRAAGAGAGLTDND